MDIRNQCLCLHPTEKFYGPTASTEAWYQDTELMKQERETGILDTDIGSSGMTMLVHGDSRYFQCFETSGTCKNVHNQHLPTENERAVKVD